jgi:photosystem II stability/assembly factor-like uncharacterized protein
MRKIFLTFLLLSFLHLSSKAQWLRQNINTTASFRTVHVVSDKNVWVSGSKGTVLRTIDGGQNWHVINVPNAEKLDFRDIYAFNEREAIIVSAGEASEGAAKIYRTEDAGQTWNLVFQTEEKGVFFDGIDFWDKKTGLVFSDPIDGHWYLLKTIDAGKTWQKLTTIDLPANRGTEAAFAASGTSMVTVGKKQAYICTGGAEIARVFRTLNQGKTWEAIDTPVPAGKASGLFGMRFWDNKHGVAVGGDYLEVEKTYPMYWLLLMQAKLGSWKLIPILLV